MKSGLSFLIAALRSEIDELDQLSRTSELVGTIGRLVHALQRERGISNVLLGSGGQRFGAERTAQIAESTRLEQAVREHFDALEADPRRLGNSARLFSRIAWVVPGLDALPALRQRIGALQLPATEATNGFVKLVAGLLAVVFEAADGATDPEISRLLVAMFNFMQGKELAGQERACGAAAFASGRNDAARQQQWLHLIESQERCFQVFSEFSGPALEAQWLAHLPPAQTAELERLRRIACAAPAGVALDPELSPTWFDCCSRRIDAMQTVEERLAADLRQLCIAKISRARSELQSHEALLVQMAHQPPAASIAFFDPPDVPATAPAASGAPTYGRQLERSILDMVQDQSQRLQAMSDELDTVRASLNERKLVERAKGLLMAHRRLSEAEAHKMLRQTAMNQNRRLIDVAESVLSMAEYLPADGKS
ncbi:nitrate- and nitrite sensing domain-containing protein [Variovorax sp. ZT4R33]|uniref:nitrate- and nitrite sensing domain-containing protein n=1 Tax=Variovorax sp. ZT4R33 TaxID=3443743 RepID=UPI003F47A870